MINAVLFATGFIAGSAVVVALLEVQFRRRAIQYVKWGKR